MIYIPQASKQMDTGQTKREREIIIPVREKIYHPPSDLCVWGWVVYMIDSGEILIRKIEFQDPAYYLFSRPGA